MKLLAIALVAAAASTASTASTAWADGFGYVRVIAQRAPVHSGPGAGYREVYFADRGQVFEVVERATRDFWYKVELDDGTTGWIVGDLVFPFEVVEDEQPGALTKAGRAIRRTILGPSPIERADASLSFSAGELEGEGMFMLRPAWLIDPYWALEFFAGLSPRSDKDIFLAGTGFTLRLAPGAVIGPYANLGLGAAYISPSAGNFVDKQETLMALGAGGGLEITLKKQITVRLDARNWTLFNQNHSSNGQELSGGLAIFF
jgi:hypothetical protein|nr:SH3 domain-containing protein [Kofleriaceae bacterium]